MLKAVINIPDTVIDAYEKSYRRNLEDAHVTVPVHIPREFIIEALKTEITNNLSWYIGGSSNIEWVMT